MSCNIPAQVCCFARGHNGNPDTYTCAATNCSTVDAGGGGGGNPPAALGCTGQANCAAGSICCVKQGGGGTSSSCVMGTSCGSNSAQLCDPNAMVTGCPMSGSRSMCSNNNIGDWGLTQQFATCGGVGN
jgi:hypothetical protein